MSAAAHDQDQLVYFISGMWCTSCAKGVRDAVAGIDGVASADVNYVSKLLRVDLKDHTPEKVDALIRSKVDHIGFGIKRQTAGWILNFRAELTREAAERLPWTLVFVVWFLAMWSSMLAFARYAGGDLPEQGVFLLTIASAAFGLPAILLGVRPYAASGLRALLFTRRLTLDLFIFIGGCAAVTVTLLSFRSDHPLSYADSGSMIAAILLLTKKIENALAEKMTSAILFQLHPGQDTVTVLKKSGWEEAEVSRIRRGDRVRVRAGQTVPLDGVLAAATGARVNAHLLSGEAVPVDLINGDHLFAGTIALSDLEMTVQQAQGQRRIDAWAEAAMLGKSRDSVYARLFSRFESALASIALLGALSLAAFASSRGPVAAIEAFFIGVLIFCPCLFASIIPLSRQMAHLALWRLGVTLSRGEALFALARVRRFYFDKTGTLEAVESQFEPRAGAAPDEVIPYLRELAVKSRHPVLRGLNFGAAVGPDLLRVISEEPGQGVSALTVSGDRLLAGRPAYLRGHGVAIDDDGNSPAVALNGQMVGRIVIKAVYDVRAREFLRRLLRRLGPGHGVTILSGDPVTGAGDGLTAIDKEIVYRGGLSPEDKARALAPGSAFVGDGLNDTLALAAADVGFRVGPRINGFAPVDFQLRTPDLNLILAVLSYARKYRRVLAQTAAAALLYNIVALTLAANGRFTPLGAVLAMFFSFSVLLLSSLRLLRVPKEIA